MTESRRRFGAPLGRPSGRLFLALAVAALFVVFLVQVLRPAQIEVVQPIAYNHKIHVEEEGLECTDCHVYVEEMASATFPALEICLDCHDEEPLSESPEEAKLIHYIEAQQEVPWARVYHVPDHVFFSHRRHVVLAELACSTCHGNVAEQAAPVTTPFVPVTMDMCMDCHKERKVTNDCLTCHR